MKPLLPLRSLIAIALSCGFSVAPIRGGSAVAVEDPAQQSLHELKDQFRRPAHVPFPKANPPTPAKVALGKALFFDPRLSRSESISCATCHNPSLGWSDGLPRAVGFGMVSLPRRTPSIRNLAWGAAFQWDGRADSLEAQARMPIAAPDEMNMPMDAVVERLKGVPGYAALFREAFGDDEPITARNVTAALATFQRTLVSGEAPFDRWISGEESAIEPDAKRGFAVFTGKAGCAACHSGWRFTDDSFHDIGLKAGEDLGRGKFAPPGVIAMQNAFKTPSLRDLQIRGPYMHDGQIDSLDAVLDHYAKGGEKRPSLSFEMKSFELSERERRDLVAFLRTLQAEPVSVTLPQLP
ncbi:tryptophan tryptophylquinone biosynthesis enzyme MauG [Methylobacterium segetis]|uniref:tryptophan tryptophylquinone biosynthesis enzyme MauG n=1 Tax=Methylobacterium segetis TaxID=2488750 RepID=UPI001048F380|nr:tryptophan tryptophylquinone biosynthesis enzyme MauG [Methylobacterium segetis]